MAILTPHFTLLLSNVLYSQSPPENAHACGPRMPHSPNILLYGSPSPGQPFHIPLLDLPRAQTSILSSLLCTFTPRTLHPI